MGGVMRHVARGMGTLPSSVVFHARIDAAACGAGAVVRAFAGSINQPAAGSPPSGKEYSALAMDGSYGADSGLSCDPCRGAIRQT
jgi:hypothetical protein